MNWDKLIVKNLDSRHVLSVPVQVPEWPEGTQNDEVKYFGGFPSMHYWYPCEIPHPQYAADELKDLPLCIVDWQDRNERGLALTGGGMDLSWEIAAGYVKLGFLPPAHFAPPPDMSGWERTPHKFKVLSALKRSVILAGQWMKQRGAAIDVLRAKGYQRVREAKNGS